MSTTEKAKSVFAEAGGTLRTSEAIAKGVHPRTLYAMRDSGVLEQLDRGLYRLADLPPLENPDLAIVAAKAPSGVICLVSALAFHELTTQIPHVVHLALPQNTRTPRLEYPPIEAYRFSDETHAAGIETHDIDGIEVRIYCPEKTLADIFKFRNRLGLDIAIESLKTYQRRPSARPQQVLEYARLCRVESVMRPYLEATL